MKIQVPIRWEERFNIGIPRLDEQHRRILEYLNLLMEQDCSVPDVPGFLSLLDEMTDYFLNHMREEEAYMRLLPPVDYLEHKARHEEFVHKIALLSIDVTRHNPDLAQLVAQFVEDWIQNHILGLDQKLRPVDPRVQ